MGYNAFSTGSLEADGVYFGNAGSYYDTYIRYNYGNGTLSGCVLDNVYLDVVHGSPTFTNDSVKNVGYPLKLNATANPVITNLFFKDVDYEEIQIGGYIEEDMILTDYGLTYGLSSDITIRDSATLTIPSGVNIEMHSRQIFVGYNAFSTGSLEADGVYFGNAGSYYDTYIRYNYGNGTLSGCVLDNVYLDVVHGSPTFTNDSIKNVENPVEMELGNDPFIEGIKMKNVTNAFISISGYLYDDYTLEKKGMDYQLGGTITIRDSAELTISPGLSIYLNGSYIKLGYNSSSPGFIKADSVNFLNESSYYDDYITFNYGSGGSITNSVLDNVHINIEQGNPKLSNDSIKNVEYPVKMELGNNPEISNLWFKDVNKEMIMIGGYIEEDLTLKNYEYGLGLYKDIVIQDSATFSIPENTILDLNSNEIYVGYSDHSTGSIIARDVRFMNEGNNYDTFIRFRYGSGGEISNSVLDNVYLDIDEGNPIIHDDTIKNVRYPVYTKIGNLPDIKDLHFKDVENEAVAISGTLYESRTLENIGLPYHLKYNLYIRDHAILTIAPRVHLDLGGYTIEIGYNSGSTGTIIADTVKFTNFNSYYDDYI